MAWLCLARQLHEVRNGLLGRLLDDAMADVEDVPPASARAVRGTGRQARMDGLRDGGLITAEEGHRIDVALFVFRGKAIIASDKQARKHASTCKPSRMILAKTRTHTQPQATQNLPRKSHHPTRAMGNVNENWANGEGREGEGEG